MNNQKTKVTMGLTIVLTTIFVVLKLTGLIDWNWFWVLSPVLIELALVGLILVGYLGLTLLNDYLEEKDRKERIERRRAKQRN